MVYDSEFQMPEFGEFGSFQLADLLDKNSLVHHGYGLWVDEPDEIGVVVTPHGVFVGWNNSPFRHPAPQVYQFGDVKHLPLFNRDELPKVIRKMRKRRKAALVKCRHCEEFFPPAWVPDQCCPDCLRTEYGAIS